MDDCLIIVFVSRYGQLTGHIGNLNVSASDADRLLKQLDADMTIVENQIATKADT